ncbi:hypothetical protein GCM10010112_68020 [Actinoplanes lobatus]|uniref:Putative GIY-YIG superfamily endonuclease n=1 Tax=Actinoplanes lobatus TaxID=113568 RepID=A0A7W7MGB0_9ACTN|nr:GIY-YIG nuclease family protein [Actinoplanes lobatus]MBB4749118.1 putative GIY-YIG superfamily endonuclease [Actinoplanes lobatus]GGN86434.1 hypothetical protein GCM10010112_68020 [Actinoplanes lobatus]GIE42784.1 hypothetical protein Alo02nite_56820 [Actinoplanes lobatus]
MILPAPDPAAPFVVYTVHSAADELLYVGVTGDLRKRMYVHKCNRVWWAPDIQVSVEKFSSSIAAEEREKELIDQLKPPHNHPRGVAIWVSGDLRRAAEQAAADEGISGQQLVERAVRREIQRLSAAPVQA